MSLKTRLSVLLISTPVLAFVLVGGLLGNTSAATSGDEKFQHLRVFYDVVDLVTNNYVTEVEPAKVMEGAIRGLAEGLDPDSAYLTPQMVRSLEAGEEPPAGDVGLDLTRQYYLRVVASRDGSAAAKAGLQTGDYVRAIDGRPTRDMSVFEGTRLLRGQPGSKVKLTVIRGNAAEPHDIELVREKFAGPLVAGRLLEGSTIGYIRVASFRGGSINELKRQATDLTSKGATALIVDVRRTTEGALENGIEAARLFVKTGTLAVKAGREKDPKIPVEAKSGDGQVTVPVTVLVATGTSGAAELFASALDGNNRADLVGERTLGRAGIQKLVKLPEGRGLWLTYARYQRPNGDPLHGRGLQPDLEVDEPAATDFTTAAPTKDPVLDAAIARARG